MRHNTSTAAEIFRVLLVLVALYAGLKLGLAADAPGVADRPLLHALAVLLLGVAAVGGLLHGVRPRFPFLIVVIAVTVLLSIIVVLPMGNKQAGYGLFAVIMGLSTAVIQFVLPVR